QVVDYPADDIHPYAGVPTKLIPDPAAPLGQAVRSIGNTTVESIQVRIGPYLPYHKNWRIHFLARVDTTPDSNLEGDGLGVAITDLENRGYGRNLTFPLKELAG